MTFRELANQIERTIRLLLLLAILLIPLWVSKWPCSKANQYSQEQWCNPPNRSIGRAAVKAVADWWDGIVIWS